MLCSLESQSDNLTCFSAPYVSAATVTAVGACVGVVVAVPFALVATGFTAAGVAAGSLAASWQVIL